MLKDIGEAKCTLEGHILTKAMAKIRVMVDRLQPIVKETIIEFSNSKECLVSLEYERLEKHYS